MKEKTNVEKLRELILEITDSKVKEAAKEIKENNDEKFVKILEQNAEFKAMWEKLENQPVKNIKLQDPESGKDFDYNYKGYDLRNQCHKWEIPEDRREKIAKYVINLIKGRKGAAGGLYESNAESGGNVVIPEYQSELLAFARLQTPILQDCRVIPMSTDSLSLATETDGVSVSWGSEGSTIATDNPSAGLLTLTSDTLAALIPATNQFLDDTFLDVVSWLTELLAEAIGQEVESQVLNGSVFTGLLGSADVNTVSCAATGTSPNRHIQLTPDEASEAIAALTANKLPGAKFYFHRSSLHYLRVSENTAGYRLFAQPGNGVPGTVFEYPYTVLNQLPATPGAAEGFAVFGNLKYYIIGRRNGDMTIEVDPYGLFDSYQTRFRVVTRWAGKVAQPAGLVVIKTHA